MSATHRLLVLTLAVMVFGRVSSAETTAPATFDAPTRLTAGGACIDTGAYVAHTGPLLHDYDGDGKTDLLVGNFTGQIQLFRNTGTNAAPVYEGKGLMEADGKTVKIPNW